MKKVGSVVSHRKALAMTRRPALPLEARRRCGRALPTPACVPEGGRSTFSNVGGWIEDQFSASDLMRA